jgi:hypothetical protein
MRKVEDKRVGEEVSPLDEMARRGAQRMIESALEVEVDEYVAQRLAGLHESHFVDGDLIGSQPRRRAVRSGGLRIVDSFGTEIPTLAT